MNDHCRLEPDDTRILDSWADGPLDRAERSRRMAWIGASIAAAIAFLLAIAVVTMLPLKDTEPYAILVDRHTGYVAALSPLEAHTIAGDAALTESFLAQYVLARESYDAASLQRDYRKVALWSDGDVRRDYVRLMSPNNPDGPIGVYGRDANVQVEIKSVSSLSARQSLVRFVTAHSDRGGNGRDVQHWAAVIDYTFVDGPMTQEDRLLNPLGFQVTRYRRDAETLPQLIEAEQATGAAQ